MRDVTTDLRARTARGTIVNGAFVVGLNLLNLARGFIVAAFLTAADYGLWGILIVALGMLMGLKEIGVADKFVQQDEPDQERAFQQAFTVELVVSLAFTGLTVAASPLVALAYGDSRLLTAGLVLSLVLPSLALQAPLWVYYRRMDFARQRALQAVNPLVGFAVTVALAATGFGYWSLIAGTLAGMWASAGVAVLASPHPLRLRFDRAALRSYSSFTWPILLASVSTLAMAQVAALTSKWLLGLAAVGAITLASSVTQYTHRVDEIVTQTLYPAICAVRERRDLLKESFTKANRLTLMWGMPFGVGLALFAPDLIHHVLGDQWDHAILLFQVTGVVAAVNHIAFNWHAFLRARGTTRPLAAYSAIVFVSFLALALPLLAAFGLTGYAIGLAAQSVVLLAARAYFLRPVLGSFSVLAHSARAIAPTVPAVLVVLLSRLAEPTSRGVGVALVELALYVAVTLGATYVFERALVREVLGYLRRRSGSPLAVTPA